MSRQLAPLPQSTSTADASTGDSSEPAPAAPSIEVKRIVKGDTFASSADFRTAFERNMIVDGRQCRADKRVSGGRTKLYRCTGAVIVAGVKGTSGCPVLVRGCKHADNEWHVTEVALEHRNCTGQAEEKRKKKPSRRAMREEAGALIKANLRVTSPALVKTLKATCGVVISERTANRMKCDILEGGSGGGDVVKEEFAVLESYLATLERDSAGTIVDCEWDKEGHFVRCFMMIGAAARMAAEGVQQAFALDTSSFKENWKGTFATLTFKDANNELLHVATVVSAKKEEEEDDAESYTYLLTQAMKSPILRDVLNNPGTTCFTDKPRGPDESAVHNVCPLTENRWCVKHLLKLLRPIGPSGQHLVYEAAKAATKSGFEKHMQDLKNMSEKTHAKLVDTPHRFWANYACRKNVIWDQTTSNTTTESLNNMTGAELRTQSVLGFLQEIVLQTGRRLNDAANLKATDATALLTPFATSIFNAELKSADELTVSPTGSGGFMVYPQQNPALRLSNRVNLRCGSSHDDRAYGCTCGWCLRWKMPCRHIIAAANASGIAAERTLELVYKGYSLASYRAAAADPSCRIVPPVWSDLTPNPKHLPPLGTKNPPGRPKQGGAQKKARIESEDKLNATPSVRIESDERLNASSSACSDVDNADDDGGRTGGGVGIARSGGGGGGGGGGGAGASAAAGRGGAGGGGGGAAGAMGLSHANMSSSSGSGHTSQPAADYDAGKSQYLLPAYP